jgi:hypothetical protein
MVRVTIDQNQIFVNLTLKICIAFPSCNCVILSLYHIIESWEKSKIYFLLMPNQPKSEMVHPWSPEGNINHS